MRRNRLQQAVYLAMAASLAPLSPCALGVITWGGTGNNYVSTTPAPGGVDQYEGLYDSYTGTTISPRIMLSANHVNAGPFGQFEFNNGTTTATTYNILLVATLDDLAVWEINPNDSANFSVYAPVYTGSSEVGSSIVDLGRGFARGSAVTGGWNWAGGNGPLSWGTNTISAIDTDTTLGTSGALGGDFLQYDFNNNPSNPNECIDTTFDSGGGLFVLNNGVYQLAGVNSLVDSVFDSQGNQLSVSLYDVYGYYTLDQNNQPVQITTHGPMSTYATRISSKQNFLGLADGTIPASSAAAYPINNDGQLVVYQNMTTGAITGGAQLLVGSDSTYITQQIATGSGASQLTALTVNIDSKLDITNNQIFITYGSGADPIASIAAYIASGFNGGSWNGFGIVSSTAAANAGTYGIGYADSADAGNPAGLASGEIELRYTLLGDANLDGKVNGTDFAILATNFNQSVSGWDQGDFNYDGKVNGTDFALLASNFNQGVQISPADAAALEAFAQANGLSLNLPEPGLGAGFTALVGVALGRRRRDQ